MRDVKSLDICLKRISNTIYDTHIRELFHYSIKRQSIERGFPCILELPRVLN